MVTATINRTLSCEPSHWQRWEVVTNNNPNMESEAIAMKARNFTIDINQLYTQELEQLRSMFYNQNKMTECREINNSPGDKQCTIYTPKWE